MAIDSLFPKMVELADRMRWHGKEVVRDTVDGPQLYERVILSGPIFEERAQEPFVVVDGTAARVVEIDPDGLSVRAYFDQELPPARPIEFGYLGDGVLYRFPAHYRPGLIERLDRERLPKGIQLIRRRPDPSIEGPRDRSGVIARAEV
ncbi:MAG: hypothetical protein IH878_14720 [Gemmatimonadetes bacterium]|nr:hypothetical protein [Gemmatimonadota bacterium]